MERFGPYRFVTTTTLQPITIPHTTVDPFAYLSPETNFVDVAEATTGDVRLLDVAEATTADVRFSGVAETTTGGVVRARIEHPSDVLPPLAYSVAGVILILVLRMCWYFACRKRSRYAVPTTELVSLRINDEESGFTFPRSVDQHLITIPPPGPPLPPPILPENVSPEVLTDGHSKLMADIREIYNRRYPNAELNVKS